MRWRHGDGDSYRWRGNRLLVTTDDGAVAQSPVTKVAGAVGIGDSRPGIKPQDSGQVMSSGCWNRDRGGRPRLLQEKVRCVTHLPVSPALACRRRRLLAAKLGEDPECFFFLPAKTGRNLDFREDQQVPAPSPTEVGRAQARNSKDR